MKQAAGGRMGCELSRYSEQRFRSFATGRCFRRSSAGAGRLAEGGGGLGQEIAGRDCK
jgi:hypothetical protein